MKSFKKVLFICGALYTPVIIIYIYILNLIVYYLFLGHHQSMLIHLLYMNKLNLCVHKFQLLYLFIYFLVYDLFFYMLYSFRYIDGSSVSIDQVSVITKISGYLKYVSINILNILIFLLKLIMFSI